MASAQDLGDLEDPPPASTASPDHEDEQNDDESNEEKPMLRAFDGIVSSSSSPRSSSPLQATTTRYVKSCCLANGLKCRRVGSSRVYNEAVYRSSSYCIVGPHFPATIFIVFFISGATYFFGFVTPAIQDKVRGAYGGGGEGAGWTLHQFVCMTFWCVCTSLLLLTACKVRVRVDIWVGDVR